MKALLCTRAGTPDDLTIADLPDPVAGPGQAVVRVEAAALNFFDLLIIAGKYQYKPEFPFSPGAEFAGTVESVGPDVTGFAAGDRVIGYSGWGAAREKIAIGADKLIKMPRRPRRRPRRRPDRHLRHLLLRAEGSRRTQARRDAGGARRLGRHRPRRGRARQAHGRARHRLRLVRRKARVRQGARRRRRRELRKQRSARRTEEARRRTRHRRGVRSDRRPLRRAGAALARLVRALSGGRLCRRPNPEAAAQPGAAEKLRRPRRVLGLMDRSASRRRIAPTPPTSSAGAPRASSARMSMPPIRWRTRRRR